MHPHDQAQQQWKYKAAVNVRASQIFYNIADDDMGEFFMNYGQDQDEQHHIQTESQDKLNKMRTNSQEKIVIVQQVQLANQAEEITIQQDKIDVHDHEHLSQKEVVSRLDIEVQKNGLELVPVYGQIFIMIINAQLIADQRKETGKLLVTNYRFAFFKGKMKKLDLPYGFIGQCKFSDKTCQLTCRLKYNHYWKIKIAEQKNYAHIKIFLQIYLKIQSIRSCFAYSYASKYPQFTKIKHNQIINEFVRLNFTQNKDIHVIDNTDFIICSSYPELVYVPVKITVTILDKIGKYWNENRFPVMVYSHNPSMHNFGAIWRSSALVCERTDDLRDVGKYLDFIRKDNDKLTVFDAGFKVTKKGLEQFEINSQCQMRYLQIDPIQNLRTSYVATVQCFLGSKKTFIKDLIASKWYDIVIQYLRGSAQIASKVTSFGNVVIKCNDGRDKSAVLSALTQIILNPYYRTFQGFSVLVQKQFQFFGHQFLSRLGLNNKNEQIPIFIMFLDCVSQLLHENQMCFEFNYKYLSKLSNLMYTCLFGTFVSNTRKQSLQNCISTQTVPIWNQLISQLTRNAYYYQKSGILAAPQKFDDIRIWKQHFWYLTTAPKQSYKIHPLAQDNLDYVNLNCHKIMNENRSLQNEIAEQKKILDGLKSKLLAKQQEKNKQTC